MENYNTDVTTLQQCKTMQLNSMTLQQHSHEYNGTAAVALLQCNTNRQDGPNSI
jgi:hypothetical protein